MLAMSFLALGPRLAVAQVVAPADLADRGFRVDGAGAHDLSDVHVPGAGGVMGDGLAGMTVDASGAGFIVDEATGRSDVVLGKTDTAPASGRACTVGNATRSAIANVANMTFDCTSAGTEMLVDIANLNQALAASRPGDTIVLRDGTYANAVVTFRPVAAGTQAAPITLRAQTRGGVTFTGLSTFVAGGEWLVVTGLRWVDVRPPANDVYRPIIALSGCRRCVFAHNAIIGTGPGPTVSSGAMIVDQGASHNLITRNRFERLPAPGLRIRCSATDCANTHNTISYNHWLDRAAVLEGENNGESLQLGQQAVPNPLYTVVEFNLFEDIEFSAELISSKTSFNTFRSNTFRNTKDWLVLRGGTDATVRDNWFFNTRGIRVHDRNHVIASNYLAGSAFSNDAAIILSSGGAGTCTHKPVVDVRILHNTIVNPAARGIFIGLSHGSSPSAGCTWDQAPLRTVVQNNAIVNTAGSAITSNANATPSTTFGGNVVSGPSDYRGVGVVIASPGLQLVDGVYRLPSSGGSLATNGVVPVLPVDDIFGRSRSATAPTVGAEERTQATPRYRPLMSSDVGPGSTTTFSPLAQASLFADGFEPPSP